MKVAGGRGKRRNHGTALRCGTQNCFVAGPIGAGPLLCVLCGTHP